jgi:hypothetical protein
VPCVVKYPGAAPDTPWWRSAIPFYASRSGAVLILIKLCSPL